MKSQDRTGRWFALKRKSGSSELVAIAVLSLSVSIFALLCYLFPLNHIPAPSGPFGVGFKTFEIVNSSPGLIEKMDLFDSDLIRLDIWYPAINTDESEMKPWIDDDPVFFNGFGMVTGYPSWLFEHLHLVKTNSFIDAAPLNQSSRWPVVIILLGWSSISELHTSLAEELASNGYVVACIEHPGACTVVSFSNGETHYFLGNDLIERFSDFERENMVSLIASYLANDIDYAMDFLRMLTDDKYSEFYGRLDLENVSLYGHSGGGAVALEYAQRQRVNSIVLADPTVDAFCVDNHSWAFETPLLLMRTAEWTSHMGETGIESLFRYSALPSFDLRIEEMRHVEFAMIRNLSPLTYFFGETGRFMNKRDSMKILDRTVLMFLETVNGSRSIDSLADFSEGIPELDLRVLD